jgi:hypothetical protein
MAFPVEFLLFVISSGLFFSERFRGNIAAVVLAGTIAVISTVFLFQDLSGRLGLRQTGSREATLEKRVGDPQGLFTADAMARLDRAANANACAKGCQLTNFEMMRLPLDSNVGRRAYLVTTLDQGWCGSAGCASAVIVFQENGQPFILREDHGITDRQAMLIAREAMK